MKNPAYKKRFYRGWVHAPDLYKDHISVEETDLEVLSDKPLDLRYCMERVLHYRGQIRAYISRDERFLTSLEPLAVEKNAPAIVRDMARQAQKADVGPMASVAGAISQYLGKDLIRRGYKDVIIENGGDLFVSLRRPIVIGLYAGRSALTKKLRLRINPASCPIGVCASSGTVGHSLSFGKADSVVILAKSAVLADAVATAAANRVKDATGLENAVSFSRSVRGVSGAVMVLGNRLASWGDVEFV